MLYDLLKNFSTFENQLNYLKNLPYLFLAQALYESLTQYCKLYVWVPNATSLTNEQKKSLLELDSLIKNSSKLNFIDPIPTEILQINEDWIFITEKISQIVGSLEVRSGVR